MISVCKVENISISVQLYFKMFTILIDINLAANVED